MVETAMRHIIKELYEKGYPDKLIAKKTDKKLASIVHWRNTHNLPANKANGVPMAEVLDIEEVQRMTKFLSLLNYYSGICYENGIKPDINAFMREYREEYADTKGGL